MEPREEGQVIANIQYLLTEVGKLRVEMHNHRGFIHGAQSTADVCEINIEKLYTRVEKNSDAIIKSESRITWIYAYAAGIAFAVSVAAFLIEHFVNK